jgi:hypothetical protein
MPVMRFTQKAIAALPPGPDTWFSDPRFVVKLRRQGASKTWYCHVYPAGRQLPHKIAAWIDLPDPGIADEKARAIRRDARLDGVDPNERRRQERRKVHRRKEERAEYEGYLASEFGSVIVRNIAAKAPVLSQRTAHEREQAIRRLLLPALGHVPHAEIDAVAHLTPITDKITKTIETYSDRREARR